tara:strand:+ start:739 stop:1302 length:564 start_codon:yes stop_codon:yes gene_type:complete
MKNIRAKAILDFWFIDSNPKDHFKKDKNFDKKIKDNFETDYLKAINNELEEWQDEPESCLALIILLDQFSRNLNRESARAFSQDYKARLIVNEAIDRGDLEILNLNQILFLLLPLIHSEDISDHIFAHKLCETYLLNHPYYDEIKKSWNEHTSIIKKFNRYPYRNKILLRNVTEQEKIFLSKSGSSW